MQFVWRLFGVWHVCQGCAALCTPAHDSHTCTVLPSALGCLSCATWQQHLTLALGQGALFIIYYLYLCAYFVRARHPELGWQGSPRANRFLQVRKAEVKTSNFGSAAVLVWLCPHREVAAPLALPTMPSHRTEAQGWRKEEDQDLHPGLTVTCDQVILKTQKQILVLADVALPHKHKSFGHWSAGRNCFVSSCCRKAWSNSAVVIQADLLCCWQLPCFILGLEELSRTELIQVNNFPSFWSIAKTISKISWVEWRLACKKLSVKRTLNHLCKGTWWPTPGELNHHN